MPELAPRTSRRVDGDADASTLERMSRLPEQPTPQWSGLFLEPDLPPADEE